MAAEKTGFTINGVICERPDISQLKMRERRLLFDLAGYVPEDFVQRENETDDAHASRVDTMTGHPGFMEAMLHIAYQREHPDRTREQVQAIVDETDFISALATLGEADEDDAGPPELTPVPAEASQKSLPGNASSSGESNGTSGHGSTTDSGRESGSLPSIGTTRSDTSSISAQEISAA